MGLINNISDNYLIPKIFTKISYDSCSFTDVNVLTYYAMHGQNEEGMTQG